MIEKYSSPKKSSNRNKSAATWKLIGILVSEPRATFPKHMKKEVEELIQKEIIDKGKKLKAQITYK